MKTASSIKQGYMAAWELMIVHICQECTVSLDKTWFSLGQSSLSGLLPSSCFSYTHNLHAVYDFTFLWDNDNIYVHL